MNPRSKMVRDIRVVYGFSDEIVLSAMEKVPRHEFVDVQDVAAYADSPISIGHGQTMSQPYTVAYMTHLLVEGVKDIKNWKVLEVGTGSGYQAAVLAEIVGQVYTIEIVPQLAKKTKKTLKKLGYNNIHVKRGSGEFAWKKFAPFDSILITAALDSDVPKKLIEQLKIGGRIVVPIGPQKLQVMTRLTKIDEKKLEKEEFENFVFVPFVEE